MDFDNPSPRPGPDAAVKLSMSGWLFRKKGGLFGGWNKSWWVLDFPGQLFSEYRSPAGTSDSVAPLVEIDPYIVKKVLKKGKDQLTIVMDGSKELTLKAEDEAIRNRWVDVFGEFLIALPEKKGDAIAAESLPTSNVSLSKNASFKGPNSSSPASSTGRESRAETDKRPLSESVNDVAVDKARASQRIISPSSKKDAAIMDTGVFMGKARNFAVSTNKDFAESAKKKGGAAQPKRDLEGAEGEESSKKRAAVIPVMTPDEQIEESRFVKTPEQKEKLLKVVVEQLSNFFGGNLFKEVEPEAIVDLMFTVKVHKDTNVVTQGEPTDRMYVIEKGSVGVYTQDFVDRPPELETVKTVGDIFGILSLLYNQPGPFTIKAHSECILWAITRRKFHELTTNQTKRRVARKIRLLEGVPLIADNLEQNIIVQLADSMEYKEYEEGQEIVKKGEALKKVFIVGDGTAKLMDGDTFVGNLQKGDAFAEWALLDIGSKADATMIATSPLTILTLEAKEVEELVGPLRAFVLRKWAETKGEQFFFSNQARGGTLFHPDSDVRNPISRLKATVQFGSNAASTDSDAQPQDDSTPTVISQAMATEQILASMNKEQEDQAIAEALQLAKARGTTRKTSSKKTIARKTKAQGAQGTPKVDKKNLTPKGDKTPAPLPETAPPMPAPSAEASAPSPAQQPPLQVSPAAPVQPGAPAAQASPMADLPVPELPSEDEMEEDDDEDEEYTEEENLDKPFDPAPPLRPDLIMSSIKLCALLGRGNFGRVHLARNEANHKELFALKVLGRTFIVQNGWESLVENERNAMLELSGLTKSPFLLSMYNSFSDKKNIYLLLELCEGGDLYNLLRITKNNRFNEEVSKFYMACVVLGLEAMQSRELVYRDLKPENLMLSRNGYIKVADFGLAKKTLRTFTVCGTPDYMAPEVILSRGHGMPVDWWAIGVLLFEMVSAITPFFGNEAMDIYENVLAHETVDDLQFPDDVTFSPDAKDLIRQLVHPKKNKRLGIRYPGVKGVKDHPFFRKFDWNQLAQVKMVPPLMPQIVDMSKYTQGNITYDPKLYNVPDDNSGWQLKF